MLRIIFSFVAMSVLALAGCVKTQSSSPTVVNSGSGTQLSSAEDPDGDGDAKGANLFPEKRPATGHRVFIFDPSKTAWAAYNEQGERVNTGRASGGKAFCPDTGRPCKTVVGTFRVLSKGGADCQSNIYPLETNGGAPMPYCMKFNSKGYAIHGSHDVPDHNASHGCIRVTPTAAAWLSQNFIQNGTTIIVRPYS